MTAIDFARSFVTFFGHDDGNIARIQIDAACTLTDERTGDARAFYLIAPCRAEEVYVETSLLLVPNYEFSGIFSDDECLLVRTHWRSDRDNREYGLSTVRFARVAIDVRRVAARPLENDAAVGDATLANHPLVAQTALRDEARAAHALLEYPVKTMNILRPGARFQVDTGPLLLPDFASDAPRVIERFDMAYILYHGRDRAEFITRKPVTIVPDVPAAMVTDYSITQSAAARNTLFAIE